MRKNIIQTPPQEGHPLQPRWIDVENLARVELSSEDTAYPIESALGTVPGGGWRAGQPGPQTVRLIFDAPVRLRQVRLEFTEREVARTQEFVLAWSPDQGVSYQEIVRQQYNFNPPGTISEREEYQVDLSGVTRLELKLNPDLGRSGARATLDRLLLA